MIRVLPLLGACVLALVPVAARGEAEDSSREAAREFNEGQSSFKAGDFRHAAECFERAYQLKPHHSALWNAARSWESAGEPARAANLYERFLREAPPKSRDRNRATTFLKQAAGKLGKLQLLSSGLSDLRVDKQPAEEGVLYVSPGQHLIEAKQGDKAVQEQFSVSAGASMSIVLKPPPEPPPPPPPAPPPAAPPAAVARPASTIPGWVRVGVPVAGAALALGAGGATIWSGLDTLSAKKTFDASPTQANLDAGRSAQLRTNVLIGVSAGLAALTITAAILLVDRSQDSGTTVAVGPQGIAVRGVF